MAFIMTNIFVGDELKFLLNENQLLQFFCIQEPVHIILAISINILYYFNEKWPNFLNLYLILTLKC